MRLDARTGDTNWTIFHVPHCKQLKWVVWVDDERLQWGEYPSREQMMSHARIYGELPIEVHQAERIAIVPSKRLVLINPIDDDEDEDIEISDVSPIAEGIPA